MRKRLTLGCVLLLGFASCANGAQSYEDLAALASAVDQAGVACADVQTLEGAELVAESGICNQGDMTLYMFDDAGDLEDWQKVAARVSPVAVGPNWAVAGEMSGVESVAEELDAELVSQP
jgi:hypothetical protein